MPQLLIDTDSESVDTLRDTVQLLNAICARRERLGQQAPGTTVVVAEAPAAPSINIEDPKVVFGANGNGLPVDPSLPAGTALVDNAGTAVAVAPEAKPKRSRKKKDAAVAAPAVAVPLPPVVASATHQPTITPAIAARIAETQGAQAPPPPPPPAPAAPLTLVGETPPAASGTTFRDVMLAITQGLQGGKLTNAEVTAICKQNGIDGPTALPAQPMLNGAILAAINALVASKG